MAADLRGEEGLRVAAGLRWVEGFGLPLSLVVAMISVLTSFERTLSSSLVLHRTYVCKPKPPTGYICEPE